ncbi:MAG: UDP-diphosphatase, partial [Desulfobacterales bacterium]|nr:UDP-diphosphatase [Desulfobacterales bacterium]
MEPIQAFILGVVQGLTEFLPISSSGHLVIFQNLFGLKKPELFFDVCVHIGTMAAVMFYFRQEIGSIIASVVRFIGAFFSGKASAGRVMEEPDLKMALLIIIGSVPTALLGLLFNEIAEE